MRNFMKTLFSAFKLWTQKTIKESASDWNQNDQNVNGYVKNRPFYTEIVPEYVVQPTTVYINGYVERAISIDLVVGNTYIVVWNGVKYECVCYSHSGTPVIGNNTCWDGNGGNGEPFLISNYNNLTAINAYKTDTHTIAILTKKEIIHKLDSKYLDIPKNVATTDDIQSAIHNAIEEIAIADQISEAVSTKMDKENPVGTGSFSMNRKEGSEVGSYSHAEGYETISSGRYSHSEGYLTSAIGDYSHVEGKFTYAPTENVHIEGKCNYYNIIAEEIAEDEYQVHAVGSIGYTISDITADLEHGYYIVGSVSSSKNLNYQNIRNGITYIRFPSAVTYLDDGTATVTDYQVVKDLGPSGDGVKFNNINYHIGPKKYAHVVGNGTSDTERSNAHTLDFDGNAWYQGDVYVGSTSGINMDEGSKKLATEKYVDEAIASIEIPEIEEPVEQVQADWNETNNLELSYIKNKPFGYKDDLYTNPELSFSLLRDSIYVGKIPQELTNLFTTGDKITVIWDQEEYDLTAKIVNVKLEHTDVDILNALGNGEILAKALESLIDGEDSGEPFAICPGLGEIYARSTSPIHSVIIRDKINVNKLDLKFLPDEVITSQPDWNESDENSDAFIKNKPIIPNFEEYSTKEYVDNAIAQKTQVQIITWEADD